MRFGLFCSPKSDAEGFSAEIGKAYSDFLDFNVETEATGYWSSFAREVMPAFAAAPCTAEAAGR